MCLEVKDGKRNVFQIQLKVATIPSLPGDEATSCKWFAIW